MAKKTPDITTSSMADVSFILLFFFLMVSSMDSDFGLLRQLPPLEEEQTEDNEINERNAFVVLISANNDLLIENEYSDISQLKAKTIEFFENPTNNPNLSEKKEAQLPFFGNVMVSKGVVSLQNDRSTSYGIYLRVQNELTAAINEMREKSAKQRFGKSFGDLTEEERDAVSKLHPMAISEAEPFNTEG